MTRFDEWCTRDAAERVGSATMGVLVAHDEALGSDVVAAALPTRYAETRSLAWIADKSGKPGVAAFLKRKFPQTTRARSGDLGEILAAAYLDENLGFAVGPSRLIDRDHQEWAMRGDDILGIRVDNRSNVVIAKVEAKSRASASGDAVQEARAGLERTGGLPSPHSLTQFGERLLNSPDEALGEAVLNLELNDGVRPSNVSHIMFLFVGNDPSAHVRADLTAYAGGIAQSAVVVRVTGHQAFIRNAFEKALAGGA